MSESTAIPRAALPLLLSGAFAIGFAPIFIRLSPLDAGGTVFYRLLLAWPFFIAVMAISWRRGANRPQGWDHLRLVAPGFMFAIDTLIWTAAMHMTTVANATLLANLAPIFVALVVWARYGERITPTFLMGMAAAFAGTGLLMGHSFQVSSANVIGDLLSILAAVFYAAYQVGLSRMGIRYGPSTVWSYGIAGALPLALAWALVGGEALLPDPALGLIAWWPLVAIALVSHFLGQGAIAYAFGHLPASFSSLTLLIQPVVAATAAWFLLGEILHPWQLAGGVVVLWGIFLARKGSLQPSGRTRL